MTSWDNISKDYENKVYSITKWKKKRDRILKEIKNNSKILILGGGSETYLQKDILEKFPNVSITISDISEGMLSLSKKSFNHANLKFVQENMLKMKYNKEFDYIISTNSILMKTIRKNNKVFYLCKKALRKNGKLIAYLPSYESCVNILENNVKGFDLDHKEMRIIDKVDGTKQSFHSKNSISENSQEYSSLKIEKVFCSESDEELNHLFSLYKDYFTKSICKEVFEWFVVLKK